MGDPEQGDVDWTTESSEKTRRAAVMLASIIANQDLSMLRLGLAHSGLAHRGGLSVFRFVVTGKEGHLWAPLSKMFRL